MRYNMFRSPPSHKHINGDKLVLSYHLNWSLSMLLQDKVAVITGGGRGIGRAIAQAYAREGAHLVLASRDLTALEETRALLAEFQRDILVLPLDLREEESVRAMAERTLVHFGHIDILVNNSG